MHTAQLAVLLGALFAPALAHAEDDDRARPKSPAMVAIGVSTIVVGSAAVATSAPLLWLFARTQTSCSSNSLGRCSTTPPDLGMVAGLTLGVVSGALAILGGIPLVYFGAKHAHRTSVWLTAGGLAGTF